MNKKVDDDICLMRLKHKTRAPFKSERNLDVMNLLKVEAFGFVLRDALGQSVQQEHLATRTRDGLMG